MYIAITAALWSLVAIALKIVLPYIDATSVNWFRFSFSFLSLLIYLLLSRPQHLSILHKPPSVLLFASVGLAFNYLGYVLGVKHTSPSTTQVIIQIAPAMFALSGFLIFKEKIQRSQIAGFIIALIGLLLFYYRVSHDIIGNLRSFNIGILWIFIAAAGWVFYAILQKTAAHSYPTLQANLIIYGFPSLLFIPFTDFSSFLHLNLSSWCILIFLGINTLISYLAMAAGLKYIEANKASVIITLNPILTFLCMELMGFFAIAGIQGEAFSLPAIIGAIMVIGGCIVVVGLKKQNNRLPS